MADVTLKIDAETAKAVRDLVKFAAAQDTATAATKRGSKAAQEHDKALASLHRSTSRTSDAFGTLPSVVGKSLAALGGFAAVTAVVNKLENHLIGVAAANREIAKSMIPLAALYGGGKFDREMIQTGAHFGLKPQDSAALGVTIPAGLGATKKDFAVGGRLTQMGLTAENAGNVVVAGISKGIGSQRAGDITIVGAGESKLTANEFSRSTPAWSGYSRVEEGAAATAAISLSGVQAERIPELTKAGGKALNDDSSKFVKKYHLEGLSESDKVLKLRAIAEQSGDVGKFSSAPNLMKKGGLDDIQAEAVGMLIRNAQSFESTEQKLTNTKPGELNRTIERVRVQRPEIARAWESQTADAELAANRYLGKENAKSSDFDQRNQAEGLMIRRKLPDWAPLLTDSQTGAANWAGRMATSFFPSLMDYTKIAPNDYISKRLRKQQGLPEQVPSGQQALQTEVQYLSQDTSNSMSEETAQMLIDALRENSAETKANTEASGNGGGGSSYSPPRDRNAGMSREAH